MYGQPEIVRSERLKAADVDFIERATELIGSREEASRAWAAEGDQFNDEMNYYAAMSRYNQAWLLDPNNYQPYWGFGQIMMIRGNVDEAILFYEKASHLIDDEYQRPALYSDLGIAYSVKASQTTENAEARNHYFALANKFFKECSELDSTYLVVLEAWANSLAREERYAEAWEKVEQAQEKGRPVNPIFRETLQKKMAKPD